MKRFKHKALKFIAVFLALNILLECVFPSVALALTSGPKSPEFMSFTPVSTSNMVDLATGDFNYNLPVVEIPGTEGGGYALSLAYNSGVNSEQEASWVGFGWNLNPGAINRNMRGFPDDCNGDAIKIYNKARPNWTISKTSKTGLEIFSFDLGLSESQSIRFNNHYGFMKTTGYGLSFKGVGLNISTDANGTTFSGSINPIAMIASPHKIAYAKMTCDANALVEAGIPETNMGVKMTREAAQMEKKDAGKLGGGTSIGIGGKYGIFTYADVSRSTSFHKYKGFNINLEVSGGVRPTTVPVGLNKGYAANFNMQYGEYQKTAHAIGYLHEVSDAPDGSDPVMDYYVEKASDVNKRDVFIGMPFSNADIFGVSGEGVSGGFRAFKKKIGNFRPENIGYKNHITTYNVGLEISLGLNNGVGFNAGVGFQNTSLNDWGDNYDVSNNGFIFRFNNDLAGTVTYGNNNNELVAADLSYASSVPGATTVNLNDGAVKDNLMLNAGAETSSFIDYHTFGTTNNTDLKTYPDDLKIGKQSICDFSICNENGDLYKYGLPVLTKNETSLSFDIPEGNKPENNYLAFRKIPLVQNPNGEYDITDINNSAYKTITGEIHNNPYASTYLLTQITKPNYVDANNNGQVDDADFGGWTKFDYRREYGGKDGVWYRYRVPYMGLLYKQNAISDTKDDIGSVITGEKEVYYLEAIETKTHIAVFVTNKFNHATASLKNPKLAAYNIGDGSSVADANKNRKDGIGAKHLSATEDAAAQSATSTIGENDLEYLEKIVLFSKARPDKPIKTVNFQYDYSLVPNLPNNVNTTFDYSNPNTTNNENSGKLTLKRVWFEYEGTAPVKISPYEFSYAYKKPGNFKTGGEYFTEYENLSDGAGSAQNPSYAPELLDSWGNVMEYAKERKKFDIPWIYQGNLCTYQNSLPNTWRKDVKKSDFDPAAWHLKSIKLPSGGEIHIQYEQKDYKYVQDHPVMAMASLIGANDSRDSWYDVNADDLGCDPGLIPAEYEKQLQELATQINAYFSDAPLPTNQGGYTNKVYFKFLYDLLGMSPDLGNPTSEYISGYAGFVNAKVIDGNKLRIYLDPRSDVSAPKQAAYDLLSNQRQGMLRQDRQFGSVDFNNLFDDAVTDIANKDTDFGDVLSIAGGMVGTLALQSTSFFNNYNKMMVCNAISPSLSFLKLPMYRAKKGGGVRVKRLLMYDAGLENANGDANGDAQMLGQQFHYVLEDGITSSGVATNEPSPAREENPLVKYIVRKGQDWFSRLTAGEDKEQTEGPLGESILPAASVYHSRVVVEDIHSDKSRSGFTVHEFFTTHDYPIDMYYGTKPSKTGLPANISGFGAEASTLDSKNDLLPSIPISVFTMSVTKLWMAQGFRFILNAMNGLSKRVTAYGGRYSKPTNKSDKDVDNGYMVSMQQNEYFEPGEKLTMLYPKSGGNGYEVKEDTPGEETEIAIEKKEIEDNEFDIGVEVDISIGAAGIIPLPFGSASPHLGISNDLVATYASTKVIRYPAILKSESLYRDGMVSKTEYLAFNASNGKPLLTKTYDGYYNLGLADGEGNKEKVGVIYQFSMPAEWQYPNMGQKSKDNTNTNQLSEAAMNITTYGTYPSPDWFNGKSISNVIDVNVKTFEQGWTSSWNDVKLSSDYPGLKNNNDAITKLKSIWRPKSSYVYKIDKEKDKYVSTPDNESTVYTSGYFTLPSMFDWKQSTQQGNWIKLSEIKKYSPHGNPLEEVDVMNIPSAVIYGTQYGNNLPVMVAQNAEYNDIYFEDFEGNGTVPASIKAHSGKKSGTYAENMTLLKNVYVTKHLKNNGGLLKFWAAMAPWNTNTLNLFAVINGSKIGITKIASSGNWSLYECKVDGSKLPSFNESLTISLTGYSESQPFYIDDVRFQPMDAQATCFVYDTQTFKLLTQFDDQHFGAYYKYNDEGVLTHKIVETERGLKTIQETQYNIPTITKQ